MKKNLPVVLDDLLHPLGHGLDKRPAVRDRCPLAPQLGDLLPQDGQTGWGWPVSQLLLHPRPEILYGIEIWRVTRPIHDSHVLELQPILDGLHPMMAARGLGESEWSWRAPWPA